jgi:hypothetical protein
MLSGISSGWPIYIPVRGIEGAVNRLRKEENHPSPLSSKGKTVTLKNHRCLEANLVG